MKKLSVFFGILLLTAGNVWSQGTNLPLYPTNVEDPPGPRSLFSSLNATIEKSLLTFDFSSATASQVIIMDQNHSNQVIYSESFASTTQVIVDLEDEGIGEGRYLLWLFAFGQWWEGEFTLEEANNE